MHTTRGGKLAGRHTPGTVTTFVEFLPSSSHEDKDASDKEEEDEFVTPKAEW
jgi:hypothetical protein